MVAREVVLRSALYRASNVRCPHGHPNAANAEWSDSKNLCLLTTIHVNGCNPPEF